MENYSMALLEAAHCGVPIVAFDTGGNSDIVRNGENGYLVPKGNIEALVEQAGSLLDTSKLTPLRQKTVVYSKKQLSSDLAFNKYLALMENL
jgi:glycosyltransferase involved in cell wall biosynthesis